MAHPIKQSAASSRMHNENVCSEEVLLYTVDGFIFMGTNFHGLNENDTFVGFKIHGHSIFFHDSYRKY